MTFRVYYLCNYYPQSAHNNKAHRSKDLWNDYGFCIAVKYSRIDKPCVVPTVPNETRIDITNVHRARSLFGKWIEKKIAENDVKDCILVPVPSKDSWNNSHPRSLSMLYECFPDAPRPTITPALSFTESRPKAHEGGARGIYAVLPYLQTNGDVAGKNVILIDDILTSGGSMLAAKQKLEMAGAKVLFGIVCGRTNSDPNAATFPRHYEDIEEPADMFDALDDLDVGWT